MKTWQPDTCDCKVEELYNGTEIVGMGEVINKCAVHASVPDNQLYDVILNKENRVKNQMLRVLLGYEEIKDLGLEEAKTNDDGSSAGLGLKDGIKYDWSFTGEGANRILNVEITGTNLTKNQKDAIKALCDTKFGEGKVSLK